MPGSADLQGQHYPARTSTQAQGFDPTPKAGVAGSNPAGGTLYEVPKDPVISGNAVCGVFAYAQPVAAGCSSMTVITLL